MSVMNSEGAGSNSTRQQLSHQAAILGEQRGEMLVEEDEFVAASVEDRDGLLFGEGRHVDVKVQESQWVAPPCFPATCGGTKMGPRAAVAFPMLAMVSKGF